MLVGALSWRWAFLINVPVALIILVLTPFVIPSGHPREGVRLDVPGAAFVTLALFATVFGITDRSLPRAGHWIDPVRAVLPDRAPNNSAAGRDRNAEAVVGSMGNLAALTIFSMEAALVFLLTPYLQDVLHLGLVTTGLIFGVPGLSSIAAGVIAGRIIERRGAQRSSSAFSGTSPLSSRQRSLPHRAFQIRTKGSPPVS